MTRRDPKFEELKSVIKILGEDIPKEEKKEKLSKLKKDKHPTKNKRIDYIMKLSELIQ